MAKILVVEDDADLCDSVCRYLTMIGMEVQGANSVRGLFDCFRRFPAEVVVLDVNLPDGSGFEAARRLREQSGPAGQSVGIVMLTARETLDDRVLGLTCGADTYMVKPVQLRELEAVIFSLLRRVTSSHTHSRIAPPPSQRTDAWSFDAASWSLVTPNGRTVALTNAEYAVLQELMAHSGQSISREQIARAMGKSPGDSEDRSIDAILTRLRRKVRSETGETLPVRAARTVGYVFAAPVAGPVGALPTS